MYRFNQSASITSSALFIGLALLLLTGCSGSTNLGNRSISDHLETDANRIYEVALAPLNDLNLRRTEIPPLLKRLVKNPYLPPKEMNCEAVKKELAELDTLIGPDQYADAAAQIQPAVLETEMVEEPSEGLLANIENVKMPEMPSTEDIVSSGEDMLLGRMLSFVRTKVSIMPFRNIVRSISGAERHEEKIAAANQAGHVRRAYLTGLAHQKFGPRCLAPPVIVEARAETK